VCLILVAWRVHADFPLVLAANRDEFFARPSAAAAWWPDRPEIFAGRDLDAGGSWLGVSRKGRWAGLTNFRDPARQRPGTPSRGALVADFLSSGESTAAALARLASDGPRYNAFNLLLSDGETVGIFESETAHGRLLAPGLYALSNHLLDTPWPKVCAGKSRLAAALLALPDDAALFELLHDDRPAPDAKLPRTGVSLAWERMLSSAFIRAPGYGTRCSTLIVQHRDDVIQVSELTWDTFGHEQGRVDEHFTRSPPDRPLAPAGNGL
jgi:uncharacterized protein with NRDE domain